MMSDARLDSAIMGLARYKPRAPAELINDMVFTVNKLGTEKIKRFGAPEAKPVMEKKAAPRQRVLGQKPPGRTL